MRLISVGLLVLVLLAGNAVAAAPADVSFTESCVVGTVSGRVLKRITGTRLDTGHTFTRRTLLKLKVGDAIEIIGCSVSKRGVILACPATLYGGM